MCMVRHCGQLTCCLIMSILASRVFIHSLTLTLTHSFTLFLSHSHSLLLLFILSLFHSFPPLIYLSPSHSSLLFNFIILGVNFHGGNGGAYSSFEFLGVIILYSLNLLLFLIFFFPFSFIFLY